MLERFHLGIVALAAAGLDLEPGQFHGELLGRGPPAPHPLPGPSQEAA